MIDPKYIAGAGNGGGKGGGGSSSPPTEDADSLQSRQFANVIDLLSEGEIQGLDDGNKSIFFDGTPVQNAQGKNNFSNFRVETTTGTPTQNYLPGPFNNVETVKAVGTQITKESPNLGHTITITDNTVDRVRVTVTIPSLQKVEDDGDIVGTKVSISILIQYDGGGYNVVKTDTIKGKSRNSYQRDYVFRLTGGEDGFPVDVRVIRNTDNSESVRLSNDTVWTSYTEIRDKNYAFPDAALVGLRFDARQFSSIPQRKYLIRGIKVRIPSNATVDTTTHLGRITYSGVWDGTFSAATWTNDPAWCLWDLLTSTRYGAGVPEASLDRYDFFAISQYCNELVDDGKNGLEARFSCNLLINQRKEVYDAIRDMTSIFRGISYYGAGSLVLLQDRPTDSQYTLGPSNVVDGMFSYSGTSLRSRHTSATVAYQTYEEKGEVAFEHVKDDNAITKYGVNNKEIKAIGCYSRGQARRLGKWTLLSEQNLNEICTFSIGIDSGVVLRPGTVVDIADPLRADTRRSGRVASAASASQITLDTSTDLSVNSQKTPKITFMLPSGLLETRSFTLDGAVVTLASALSEVPAANAPWLIQTDDIQSQQFRVMAVVENDDHTYGVTAVKYNQTIYGAVEEGSEFEEREISGISDAPKAVSGIVLQDFLYADGPIVRVGVDVSWQSPVKNVKDFALEYRLDDGNFIGLTTDSPSIQIKGLKDGLLEVKIVARSFTGETSPVATNLHEIRAKSAVPGDVQNLTIEPVSQNNARLRWDETVDLDVKVGGSVHIRHSNLTDGTASWSNSSDLVDAVAGNSTEEIVPLIAGEYLVKFVDDGGRKSVTEASVIVTEVPNTQNFQSVKSIREDTISPTPFAGVKTDVIYDSSANALSLARQDTPGITGSRFKLVIFDATNDTIKTFDGTFSGLTANFVNHQLSAGDKVQFRINTTPFVLPSGLQVGTTYFVLSSGLTANTFKVSETDGGSAVNIGTSGGSNSEYSLVGGTVKSSGEYQFEKTLDFGNIYTVDLERHIVSRGNYPDDTISSKEALISTWPSISGGVVDGTNAKLYVRTTNTSVANIRFDTTFTDWQPLTNGSLRARAFQFKVVLTSNDPSQNILVDQLGVNVKLQQRSEQSSSTITATSGTASVDYTNHFFNGITGTTPAPPYVGVYVPTHTLPGISPRLIIIPETNSPGEGFVLSSVDREGFSIAFFDPSDNSVFIQRDFNYVASGFGKQE